MHGKYIFVPWDMFSRMRRAGYMFPRMHSKTSERLTRVILMISDWAYNVFRLLTVLKDETKKNSWQWNSV